MASRGKSKMHRKYVYSAIHRYTRSDRICTECRLSNGIRCSACARLLDLKAKIEETKKILDKLLTEELHARMQVNCRHDPLHKLPANIVSHIFALTLPDFELQERVDGWSKPRHIARTCSEPGVLALGAVCKVWRIVAWSTPQLWSNIMLALKYSKPTDNMIGVVKEWLKRSGRLPLSIRLYIGHEPGITYARDEEVFISPQIMDLIDVFIQHSFRWKDLSVQCDTEVLEYFLNRNTKGTHRLKKLQLIQHCDRNSPQKWLKFRPSGEKPKPHHITATLFRNLQDIYVSWENATSVTVECLVLPDCIKLLRIAPKLVDLRLQDVRESDTESIPPKPKRRTLPHLRDLYVSSSTSTVAAVILDHIAVPSLEKLSINGTVNKEGHYEPYLIKFPFANVKKFLRRSSCSLTSFTLEHNKCEEQKILDTLSILPSVKNVQLNIRTTQGGDHNLSVLFNHLSYGPSSTDGMPSQLGLLPNLETFQYRIIEERTQIPWDLLASIARPVSGEKRPFKALTILQRKYYHSGYMDLRLMITKDQNIKKDTIYSLIGLQEEGVDLYLPTKVTREDLLDLLEDSQ